MPRKTEFSLEIFTVLNMYFLSFRSFEQLALALKNKVCPGIFHYYLSFRIFEQLALALKNKVALESFTVLKHILFIRFFEQLALALKNRVCPGRFYCIE